MSTKAKKRNNFIIIICVLLLAVLTYSNQSLQTDKPASQKLFDSPEQLLAISLPSWQAVFEQSWRCQSGSDCLNKVAAWQSIELVALAELPQSEEKPVKVTMQIANLKNQIQWRLYVQQGILVSQNQQAYQITSPAIVKLL